MTAPSPYPSRNLRAAFLVTGLGGLLFTLDLPLLRLAMADQWTMVFARGLMLFATITATWAVARARGERVPFLAGAAGLAVAAASTVGNISYIGAVVNTDAANVVFLIALTPVIAAALSHLVLGEKVHPFTWAATVMAFVGAAIIASAGLETGHWAGDGMAFLSAFCSASILTIIRATGLKLATSLSIGSLASALLALIFFHVAPATLLNPGAYGLPSLFWIACNGLLAIPLATLLLARGPRLLPSADVSLFYMLETVLTPVWVWLLFGEVPGPSVTIGGAVIVVTLLSYSWWRLVTSLKGQGNQ